MNDNPAELVEALRKALKLTRTESVRYASNLILQEANCLCDAPSLPSNTARIPVLICQGYVCVRLEDLGDFTYETQKAILGYYV